jgi:mannose-6-phosphate isomerase-like protein (cupin superfamily)
MKPENSVFESTAAFLKKLNFTIEKKDLARPWGGFYVIDESQAEEFASYFFPEEKIAALKIAGRLSPKILMVAPGKRLSWQYHHRRAEIWKCLQGDIAVATSDTDEEAHRHHLHPGEIIKLKKGKRHRLIGLSNWGVVAEIWQHTDAEHPSDEDDIIRLQDDFGR